VALTPAAWRSYGAPAQFPFHRKRTVAVPMLAAFHRKLARFQMTPEYGEHAKEHRAYYTLKAGKFFKLLIIKCL